MSSNFDIHSLEFYKLMAQAKADLDKSGKVDTDEEQSIFDNYMQRFERDGKNGITQDDVFIYHQEVTESEDDKIKKQRFDELDKRYDSLSFAEKSEYLDLIKWYNNKTKAMLDFTEDTLDTIDYMLELAEKREEQLSELTNNKENVDLYSLDLRYKASKYIESFKTYYPRENAQKDE